MTLIPDQELQLALNSALATAFPTMPIAWENAVYKPIANTAYLKAFLLPAETMVETLGPTPWQERKGIFQVSVVYPIGGGFLAPKIKAVEVVSAFKASTAITSNGLRILINKSWPGPGFFDTAGWYQIPVSVSYSCYSDQ